MATRAGMAVRGDQLWNPNITWQPIPVHTRPQEYDRKLNMGAPCPRYDELYDIELQSPAVKAEEKENKHDSTVAAVSQAMQVFNQKSPPYAAALLVELHQMSDGYKVRLRYRNDTQQDPYPLYHPACPQDTEYCPLDTFVKGTKDRVPEDWAAECHVVTDDEVADVIAGTVLALMVVIMILCALLIITAIAWYRNQRVVRNFQRLP
nr:hypothetical protein BaRGS_006448 [Batillaria attramentaria]